MGFDVPETVWSQCQSQLRSELPEQQYNTWIRPLTVHVPLGSQSDAVVVQLMAPNRFIEDWVKNKFLSRIEQLYADFGGQAISLGVVGRVSGDVAGQVQQKSQQVESQPVNGEANNLARRSQPLRAELSVDRADKRGGSDDSRIIVDAPAIIQSAAETSLKTNLNNNFTFARP